MIEELKKDKDQLEKDIKNLISEFIKKHGDLDIDVKYTQEFEVFRLVGSPYGSLINSEVEVKITI